MGRVVVMVCQFVGVQATSLIEGHPAGITHVAPLIQVNFFVFLPYAACGEMLVAKLALMRLFARMSSFVRQKGLFVLKRLSAVVAEKLLFFGVSPHVSIQVALFGETPATNLADMWKLSQMLLRMSGQVLFGFGDIVAKSTRKHSVVVMFQLVAVQVHCHFKCLSA